MQLPGFKAGYKNIRLFFLNWPVVFIITICILFFGGPKAVSANTSGGTLSFTFDVVAQSTLDRVKPVLSSKNMQATVYIETANMFDLLNQPNELSWVVTYERLKELQDTYGWEIGSHSVNHPRLTQLADQALDFELYQSKVDLMNRGLNVESFATPYGDFNSRVLARIAKYYKSHRGTWTGQNIYPFNDYNIRVINIRNTTTPLEVKLRIEEAKQEDEWLVLVLHGVVENDDPSEFEYKFSDFQKLVDVVAESGIRTTTFSKSFAQAAPNMLSNGSFESLNGDGWADNWSRQSTANVTIDQEAQGAYPSPKNSLKISTDIEDQVERVKSDFINIDQTKKYLVKFYENMQIFNTGSGIRAYIDEYNANNEWISGKFLGASSVNFVGTRSYTYSPNVNTAKIKLQFYSYEQSKFTWFIDQVSITEIDSEPPQLSIINPKDDQLVNGLIDIKAQIDDSQNGKSDIASASFSVDDNGSTQSMIGEDGAFDSPIEAVKAILDTRILADGNHTIRVKGKDAQGNEVSDLRTIKVDKKAPDSNVSINRESLNISAASVALKLSSSDPPPGSGVQYMRLRNENGAWLSWEPFKTTKQWNLSSGRGVKSVFAQFKDYAGNESNIVSDSITIFPLPETTLGPSLYSDGLDGWHRTAPIITLSRNVDGATLYRWDSGSWNVYSGPFRAPRGTHTLYYFSKNGFEELEVQKSMRFKVDNYRPGTYAKRVGARRKGARKIAAVSLPWKVKDDTGTAYVKLKIQKRLESHTIAKGKAEYLSAYKKYREKYLAHKKKYRKTRNRTLGGRYQRAALRNKKAMNRYLSAYRKLKTVVYKTVKAPNYRWISINKWQTYKWKTRSAGTYRYLVYAKDKSGNGQHNIAKGYVTIW